MWCALESVFMGGDIARQMPGEAKKFAKIDRDWAKMMATSHATARVVEAVGCSVFVLRVCVWVYVFGYVYTSTCTHSNPINQHTQPHPTNQHRQATRACAPCSP